MLQIFCYIVVLKLLVEKTITSGYDKNKKVYTILDIIPSYDHCYNNCKVLNLKDTITLLINCTNVAVT